MKRRWRWTGYAGILIGLGLGLKFTRRWLIWDHFAEVKPGILYRCGQLHPYQLRLALRRYGIHTVVNLRREASEPDMAGERRTCGELGVRWIQIPMPGNGFGQPGQFQRFLELAGSARDRPVLVHCARGSYRTGASVALYRLRYDGWTLSDVTDEMAHYGCRGRRLPEYVASIWKSWNSPDQEPGGGGSGPVVERRKDSRRSPAASRVTTDPARGF